MLTVRKADQSMPIMVFAAIIIQGGRPPRGSQQSMIKLSYKFKQITVYTVTNVRDLVGKRG